MVPSLENTLKLRKRVISDVKTHTIGKTNFTFKGKQKNVSEHRDSVDIAPVTPSPRGREARGVTKKKITTKKRLTCNGLATPPFKDHRKNKIQLKERRMYCNSK